ncbi:FAD-binding protein [Micrococcus sp. M4NT]|uniref:FAD-binding oxidoreductase n=1 Tax=Micrococcus sp. M4NT TaxID=2957501 RepID=UPI0029B47A46|nr:FAD-linked oxidase C-terminal domain-containing protein [Micrococcus sp. M4NT]MDX2341758.1 FAD-binding protein [Micrococcus sp. M4NT]
MTTTPDVLALLERELPGRVDTAAEALEAARTDRSGHRSPAAPLAVVRAGRVEDVQAACRIAHATRTPLVTRGAGTGLAGGAVAGAGEIVLDVRAMDRILEVSPSDRVAVVEPGILNGALNARLAEHGLWWAPDPASKDISTVGGNIAMNAGGLLCAKYGVTREAVLGLDVVLADGTLLRLGHRTVKGVTGYDLTALLIGSEGTLGVIVGATLALRPLVRGAQVTLGGFFSDVVAAAAAAQSVTGAGHVPALMELMDEATLAAVRAYVGPELGAVLPERGAFLLVQADGAGAAEDGAAMAALMEAAGGAVTATADPREAEALMALRRSAFPALEALGTPLVEDVAVPRSRMAEMFARIREIEARTGVAIPTSAHAGDGNLHPVLVFGSAGEVGGEAGTAIPEAVWEAAGELFAAGLELGGTLTGEHGVGLLKRAFLKDELGEAQHALQQRIKAVFDPHGILNPGKMFTPDTA